MTASSLPYEGETVPFVILITARLAEEAVGSSVCERDSWWNWPLPDSDVVSGALRESAAVGWDDDTAREGEWLADAVSEGVRRTLMVDVGVICALRENVVCRD